MNRKLSFISIVVLLLLSFYGGHYYADTKDSTVYLKTIDTVEVRDSFFFSKPILKVVYRDTGSVKVLTYTDTIRIIDSSFVYVDSLINDSIQLYIKDTIFRSQIVGRSIFYSYDRIYNTNIIEQKKRFFLRAGISYNNGLTPLIGFNNFTIGYNFRNKRPTFAYIVTIFKK